MARSAKRYCTVLAFTEALRKRASHPAKTADTQGSGSLLLCGRLTRAAAGSLGTDLTHEYCQRIASSEQPSFPDLQAGIDVGAARLKRSGRKSWQWSRRADSSGGQRKLNHSTNRAIFVPKNLEGTQATCWVVF